MKKYCLANLGLNWKCKDYEFLTGTYFDLFKVDTFDDIDEVIEYEGKLIAINSLIKGERIAADESYELYEDNNEKLIIYKWAKSAHAIAIYPNRINCYEKNICYLDYSLKENHKMNLDWFFGIVGLHRVLLQKNAPILHASFIDYKGEAILFSAPSGTGKSTQADLWNNCTDAEIINGDRVLLRNIDGSWMAFGYPSCGSSRICINRALPIKAIILLEKGKNNSIECVSLSEKISKIASAIEVYNWDLDEVNLAINIAQNIVNEVNVIKYSCRTDKEAVEFLKNYLETK